MRLATRILILFILAIAIVFYLVITSYLNQIVIIEHYKNALITLNDLHLRSTYETTLSRKQVYFDYIGENLNTILGNFNSYKQRIFIQSIVSFVIAMILFAFAMTSLRKHVLSRFNIIGEFIKNAYKQGLTHRRINLSGRDEISELSELVNKALDSIDSSEASLEGHHRQNRKIIDSLIKSQSESNAYFRINGDLIGSNVKVEDEKKICAIIKQNIDKIINSGPATNVFELSTHNQLMVETIGAKASESILIKAQIKNDKDKMEDG